MRYTLFIFAVFLVGCGWGPFIPPTPFPANDADCKAACSHWQDLGCPEGEDLEDGTSCEDFCVKTQGSGHDLNPSCILTLTSCDDEEQEKCQGPRDVLGGEAK